MFFRNLEEVKALDISHGDLYPILEVLNIGIMITNERGEITFYNSLHEHMDGLSASQVLGHKVTEVYQLDESSSLIMRCLRTGRPIIECPVIYKTRDGQIVDSIHNVLPLEKNGEICGAISFVKDYQRLDEVPGSAESKAAQLSFPGDTDFNLEDIIGSNVTLLDSISRVRMAAQTDSPVLIYGETGTGKELFAQSIHNLSSRKASRYIAVNCAAIPESLLEGILFGTSKGAFTGAIDKAGLFERANGGTLFLDEVNSMNKEMQPKLLRVIQEKRVCRLGSHRELKLDLKIISSINENLEQTIVSGDVRRDLLYRLSVVYISLPPLRDRKEDIIELTDHFITKYNTALNKNVDGISPEVKLILENHTWPGNVRELENLIEGSMNMMGGERVVERWHLTSGFNLLSHNDQYAAEHQNITSQESVHKAKDHRISIGPHEYPNRETGPMNEQEKEIRKLSDALHDADGNISDAAVILGISRQTFYRKIKSLGIKIPSKTGEKQREEILTSLQAHGGNITRAAADLGISRQLLRYRMKKLCINRNDTEY